MCGSVDRVLAQLIGGIQSGMGYLGAANLAQLREKARLHPRQPRRPARSRAARRGGVEDGELKGTEDGVME